MGSRNRSEPWRYVGRLVHHASKLQRDACSALARGEYARAAALIDDAELLTADVHDLVDAIEACGSGALILLAASQHGATSARPKAGRWILSAPPRRIRAALGTSIAMSLALVEC